MRLDKYLCKSTQLSLEQSTLLIHSGAVTINGTVSTNERQQVHKNNLTQLHGKTLTLRPFRYILLHKPANTICSNRDGVYPSVFNDLSIENTSELHIAGRLDADTTGLALITDDGHWSFNITRPEKQCEKIYRVGLSKAITSDVAAKFTAGITLQGEQKPTRPAALEIVNPTEALLTITEGRFHQVKRMFAAVGNRVVSLHRERIGTVQLDVGVGQWRHLTPLEVNALKN